MQNRSHFLPIPPIADFADFPRIVVEWGIATGRSLGSSVSALVREAVAIHRKNWRWQMGLLALWGVAIASLIYFETNHIIGADILPSFRAHLLARWFYQIGKTEGVSLCLVAGLSLSGLIFRRANLRRTALAVALAVLCSGAVVNVVKPLAGRVRPSAVATSPFAGPHLEHQFQSFPSGHLSEAVSFTTILAITYPPTTLVTVPYCAVMAWSRFELKAHNPSDLLAGAVFAALLCWPLGLVTRRRNCHDLERKHAAKVSESQTSRPPSFAGGAFARLRSSTKMSRGSCSAHSASS